MIAVALAGSIFFSIDPSAARWRVALYLLLTIAPFVVVTPLIGPAIDRAPGGRRVMIVATTAGRAAVAFLMVRHMHSLWLFPEAFLMLVLQKTYAVANRAVVPKLVASQDQLVEANSKLALLSALAGMSGGALGAMTVFIGGPGAVAALAFVSFSVATVLATRLPAIVVAALPMEERERVELHGHGIIVAASSMAILRGVVGFLSFLLAFELRGGRTGVHILPKGGAVGAATALARDVNVLGEPNAPAWHFGLVLAAAGIGALVGARLAPALRRAIREERILAGVLVGTALVGVYATWAGGLTGAVLLSLAVSVAAAAGKLAFDSIVQRDAPDANYGRSFARFEARFQLTWVLGAFVPVAIKMPEQLGFAIVALAAGFAAVSYVIGTRRVGTRRVGAVALSAGPVAAGPVPLADDAPADVTAVIGPAPFGPADPTTILVLPGSGPDTGRDAPVVPTAPADPTGVITLRPPGPRAAPAAASSTLFVGPVSGAAGASPGSPPVPRGSAPRVSGGIGVEVDPVDERTADESAAVVGQVDAGQPQTGRIDLGRGG
jgi:hypothetical protein